MNPPHVPHSLVGSVGMSMAGNEWINGYLKAILDSGMSAIAGDRKPPATEAKDQGGDRGHFNPTKYFVEEVVTGVDETDLYRTWIKVVATRDSHERSTRLENTCWRIWHLARKKKQLEWEDLQRAAKRRWEREQVRKDATEDMSEDLSEGEKGDTVGELVQSETPRRRFQRNFSDLQVWSDENKEKKLYIVLIRVDVRLTVNRKTLSVFLVVNLILMGYDLDDDDDDDEEEELE